MNLVDSHCHLDYYEPDTRAEVLTAAREAGLVGLVSISTRPGAFPDLLAICEDAPDVWCSAGLHPVHIDDEDFDADLVLKQAQSSDKVVAIGESGLDYFRTQHNKAHQQDIFREHIRIAQELNKVLVVHTREADDDTVVILNEGFAKKPFKAILHCFTGSKALLDLGRECDFFVSYSGMVTFRKLTALRETIREVTHNRILVETDAPYLAPEPFRGKRNQPAYIRHTVQCVANEFGCSFDEMADLTRTNFMSAFQIPSLNPG